ncbi:MAG: pilus assembly protein, partial [Deltaproteobacteria bacterium]|nr:pilus assembly protein [Deltaproteobacteria bacterium]
MNLAEPSSMFYRRMNNQGRTQRGQAIFEFAAVLITFLAVVFAVIEISRAWAVKQAVTNAAREGARVLILPYGPGLAY